MSMQYSGILQDTPCAVPPIGAFSRLSGIRVSSRTPPVAQSEMTSEWRASTRTNVLRVVARYYASSYDVGSAAGKWAIHDTRADPPEIDIEEASVQQLLDAIALADLRRKVNAKPARPVVMPSSESPFGLNEPLRHVIPASLAARVVRSKPTRSTQSSDSGTRGWRVTVGWCFKPLPGCCVDALRDATAASFERVPVRNRLEAARSNLERARGGGRRARRMREYFETRVRELAQEDSVLSATVDQIVTGPAHRAGLIRLEREIFRFPDRPAEVFGVL